MMRISKGFTLIELLVVISIIAILLGILIPALGKAKIAAEEVLCKTNLHQYQIATHMFNQDNNDKYPNPHKILYKNTKDPKETSNGWERFCRWHNKGMSLESYPELAGPFWPYLATTKVHACRTFAKIAVKYKNHPGHNNNVSEFDVQYSYSMNEMVGGKKISSMRNPSHTFLWAEENMWKLNNLADYVLNDNNLWMSAPSLNAIIDNFGSFHKISTNKLALQRDTNEYNGGVSNVLLIDGSVTFLSPEQGEGYAGYNLN